MSLRKGLLGIVGAGIGVGCGTVFASPTPSAPPPSAVPSAPPATSPEYDEMVAKVTRVALAQVSSEIREIFSDERARTRERAERLVSSELREQLLSPRVREALSHCQSKLKAELREEYENQLIQLTRENLLLKGVRLDYEQNCNSMLGKMVLINIITTMVVVGIMASKR
eukprot:TRINITY_DN9527_c0_g2_i1.p1 TRINITY_DN9527_c0_g2~~TRINITY_DN9527_c0_g2_i1.p1  ORF type:complete len:169 (+),score=27.11 TRINITY_DN9527_c0_g2_i1:42-548(+)